MQSTHAAKISRPRTAGIYPRLRLFELLDAYSQIPVIWITSPPGAGKTTLVSSYIETRHTPVLWYQVDDGDGDIPTFFYYLGLAAKKATPRKRKSLPLLTPEYQLGISAFARNFFRALYDRFSEDFVLVFDNYQDAGNESGFHSAVMTGLAQLPGHGRVFIISRAGPPAEFARMRANNLIRELQWADIGLTRDELKGILEF